jgi:hypothetical protein
MTDKKPKRGGRKTSSKRKHLAREKSISRKPWLSLNPTEKATRIRSLEALRIMREGKSLAYAARYAGSDPRTIKANLKGFIFKRHGRYKPRKQDSIQRGLNIMEKGSTKTVILNSSAKSSLVGSYYNDVKRALTFGNIDLEKWEHVRITDIDNVDHFLETDIEMLKEIKLRQEDSDFNEGIYA